MGARPIPRSLWWVLGSALALRLALLPFIHPWDGNTFHSLFAQLAAGENPYATFHDLSVESRSRVDFGYARWYEYFAYPPALLYLYWPLAKIAALFGPLQAHFPVPGVASLVPNAFPLSFLFLYKLPIWAADFTIGWVLWTRTRSVGAVALYLLNPLVLVVSGAWMFDAIPAALTLLAWLAFEKERMALSGALLALGFLTKFYPIFLLPVFFMALVWRRDRRAFVLVAAFALTSVLLVAPLYPEIGAAFAFNEARQGGGLSLHQVVQSWLRLQHVEPARFEVVESPLVGAIVLVGGMALAYVAIDKLRPRLEWGIALALLAFLLASKVVNEQYILWVLPFLILVGASSLHQRIALHLLWVVPFLFLLVHVPVTAFWPGGLAITASIVAHRAFFLVAAAVAAIAFAATVAYALWAYRPPRRVPA